MAASNKSSNRKKSTRSKSAKQAQIEREEQLSNLRGDIIRTIVILFAILLFLSNLKICGKVGNAVGSFFFGIFGLFEYVFPLVIIVFMILSYSHLRSHVARFGQKVLGSVILVISLCFFMNLAACGGDLMTPVDSYQYAFQMHNGGGIVGGILYYFLCNKWFGTVASYIISIVGILISIILLTNQLLTRIFAEKTVEQTERVGRAVREYNSEENRENRRQRRMDRKAPRGVSADTIVGDSGGTVSQDGKASDEMREIFASDEEPIAVSKSRTALNSGSENSYTISGDVERDLSDEQFRPEQASLDKTDRGIRAMSDETPYEPEQTGQKTSPVRKKAPEVSPEEKQEVFDEIAGNMQDQQAKPYVFPSSNLLSPGKGFGNKNKESELKSTGNKLIATLNSFGVEATIENVSCGPAVTRYEIKPAIGIKVSKIINLADDIKLSLAAADIRIEAPVPGTSHVGIEVPNRETSAVAFRDLIESNEFQNAKGKLTFGVGRDLGGKIKVADIAKMPHLLIAGATGSGKSVCINTIIMSILFKASPQEVKLIMIDPKVVELSVYNGIPHLLIPVVTDPKKAAGALQWAVNEMTDRYEKFAASGVRDLAGYNKKQKDIGVPSNILPQLVVIVDELADLMMTASKDVEGAICRLAQLARAAGIHLIIATQRPSVDVITGLIKANMPSRIAFSVTSNTDSRTILDMAGAEKLLGKGDMLFFPQGLPKPERIQGAFVSDKDVSEVVEFIKNNNEVPVYDESVQSSVDNSAVNSDNNSSSSMSSTGSPELDNGMDALVYDAAKIIVDKEKASIGSLQRYLKIGFNRAARIMEQLEELGVVGPEQGTKPREVLMGQQELEDLLSREQ